MLAADRINVFPVNNVLGTVRDVDGHEQCRHRAGRRQDRQMAGQSSVGVDFGRLRRMTENSRDAVLTRAGYAPDLFGSCLRGLRKSLRIRSRRRMDLW